jgi:hypothetical protein
VQHVFCRVVFIIVFRAAGPCGVSLVSILVVFIAIVLIVNIVTSVF